MIPNLYTKATRPNFANQIFPVETQDSSAYLPLIYLFLIVKIKNNKNKPKK